MHNNPAVDHSHFPSFYWRLRWSFGLMTLCIFSLFWSLIYFAEDRLEILSLHHWLDTEASQYARDFNEFGFAAPLPNIVEFRSYWSEEALPNWLLNYTKMGFYEHLIGTEDKHFIVSKHPSGKGLMYIVFQDDADDYLDSYEADLHYLTLFLGGAMTLAMLVYGLYVVRTLSQPLAKILQKVGRMPLDNELFDVETQFRETREIESSLLESKINISNFFIREKEFSRFASHELRTPIMVIKGSTELLQKIPDLPHIATKAIARLERASDEMALLTDTFLLLGRGSVEQRHMASYSLESLLSKQIGKLAILFAKNDASYRLRVRGPSLVYAPASFVTVIIDNLIKNAFSYSVGDIDISITDTELTISNCHDGHELYNEGYGCGLVIVERICERMDWIFEHHNTSDHYVAIVNFSKNV
ncbi:HAMP domain-containing histidine kinase [Shewanella sp. VB17]|uniref:sensor histidine kinase n=1 Tax=Shewanella sp. VB17 TaxID=2739432 RepID=UPI001566A019|nr:HAMP domain-containing sensor histidine kinase [Shewanella sp. VB17]NRD74362.1 HAMP domain-containing histidine kinase [Shewanella sp. VB17]